MNENTKIEEVLKRRYNLIRLRQDGLIEISSMHHFHILTPTQLRELYDIVTDALQYAEEYGEANIMSANKEIKGYYDSAAQQSMPSSSGKKHSKYCYIIKDTTRNIYKIGAANSIKNRLSAIKTSNPYVHIVYVIDGAENEKLLHEYFDSQRVTREWFKLNDLDLEFIKDNFAIVNEYK